MNYMLGPSFPAGIGMFQTTSVLIFLLAAGIILTNLIRSISQWNKNNHAPRLTVAASVVAKRTHVSRRRGSDANMHHRNYGATLYYVTFQVESGDRMELNLSGQEYGMLVEGDRGNLSFQGTRYLGFERT